MVITGLGQTTAEKQIIDLTFELETKLLQLDFAKDIGDKIAEKVLTDEIASLRAAIARVATVPLTTTTKTGIGVGVLALLAIGGFLLLR